MERTVLLHWPGLALRGFLAVVFGLMTFFLPVGTIYAVTLLFGAYALIGGIASLAAAIYTSRRGEHFWEFAVHGLLGLSMAVVTIMWPTVTLVALIYLIATWAVFTGVLELTTAVRMRRHLQNEWLLGLIGATSIFFGALLFASPVTGAVVLAWWLGAYVLFMGVLLLSLAFRLRRRALHHASFHPQHV